MSLLKDLYYGNLFPADFHMTDQPQYRQTLEKLVEKENQLNTFLPPDMQTIFEAFEELQDALSSETAYRSFREGMKLGCRLMAELLPEEK